MGLTAASVDKRGFSDERPLLNPDSVLKRNALGEIMPTINFSEYLDGLYSYASYYPEIAPKPRIWCTKHAFALGRCGDCGHGATARLVVHDFAQCLV